MLVFLLLAELIKSSVSFFILVISSKNLLPILTSSHSLLNKRFPLKMKRLLSPLAPLSHMEEEPSFSVKLPVYPEDSAHQECNEENNEPVVEETKLEWKKPWSQTDIFGVPRTWFSGFIG